ncbi:MAG: DUF3037 domain-containing protein [Bacteroidota bacterium]
MPGIQPYEYAVIRYVPRVELEEFVNVGVILFSKRLKFLGIEYRLDAKRLTAFDPEVEVEELADYLRAWDLICAGGPSGGRIGALNLAERFRWLTATRSTVIQCSKTHPGRTDAPQKVLAELFACYVR